MNDKWTASCLWFVICMSEMMRNSREHVLSPVHTNAFSNEIGAVLLRFQKNLHPHLSFSNRFHPSTLQRPIRFETQHMRISIYRPAKLKPHVSVCPPFWILMVEWSGARSCLFWWRHRFQIAWFSPSTLEDSIFKSIRKECIIVACCVLILISTLLLYTLLLP